MASRIAKHAAGALAAALAFGGTALAQPGPTSGMAGGPSNGYAGAGVQPRGSPENTPVTGGGPTTQTGRSTADEHGRGSDVLVGRVEKFDKDGQTLRLKGVDRQLKVDSSTDVMKNGSRASLDDVKEGEQVRASMSTQSDEVKQLDILGRGSSSSTTGKPARPHEESGFTGSPSRTPRSDTGSSGSTTR